MAFIPNFGDMFKSLPGTMGAIPPSTGGMGGLGGQPATPDPMAIARQKDAATKAQLDQLNKIMMDKMMNQRSGEVRHDMSGRVVNETDPTGIDWLNAHNNTGGHSWDPQNMTHPLQEPGNSFANMMEHQNMVNAVSHGQGIADKYGHGSVHTMQPGETAQPSMANGQSFSDFFQQHPQPNANVTPGNLSATASTAPGVADHANQWIAQNSHVVHPPGIQAPMGPPHPVPSTPPSVATSSPESQTSLSDFFHNMFVKPFEGMPKTASTGPTPSTPPLTNQQQQVRNAASNATSPQPFINPEDFGDNSTPSNMMFDFIQRLMGNRSIRENAVPMKPLPGRPTPTTKPGFRSAAEQEKEDLFNQQAAKQRAAKKQNSGKH